MSKLKKRVLVAMSGGVDSSVAAYLLKNEGYDVEGVTMRFGIEKPSQKKPKCCDRDAVKDAKKVCLKLGISHRVLDFSTYLEKKVINNFVSQYATGKTPNPCVECNRELKFGSLLDKALSLGFDFLATGHYAKIEKKNKEYFLKRANDLKKDQSYFLYAIKKTALKHILFPLASLDKERVRNIAKKIKLPVAQKTDSQDLCFINGRNYHDFLAGRMKTRISKGPIVDLKERVLGQHKGAFFYTVGQRGGLGIGYKHPLYVLAVNSDKNSLVVGPREDLASRGLFASNLNVLVKKLPKEAVAKIRHNHKESKCKIIPEKKGIKVIFDKPEEAVTPGQSVVFYENDTVLGGGVIEKAIK